MVKFRGPASILGSILNICSGTAASRRISRRVGGVFWEVFVRGWRSGVASRRGPLWGPLAVSGRVSRRGPARLCARRGSTLSGAPLRGRLHRTRRRGDGCVGVL